MSTNEETYIKMRRRKARALSLRFLLCRLFPINQKKVVFSSYEGDGGFCCNPRYIAEELHRKDATLQLIWLTHNDHGSFPKYIHVIEDTPWRTAYELSTAHIWIDNYRKPFGTLKRKGQMYIQTWHASLGFKAVGLFRGDAFPRIARIVSEWDSNLIDYMISNSDYCDQVYPKKLLYDGPTLRSGSPRVDPLINSKDKLHYDLRQKLHLGQETKLLLFAPTFRGGNNKEKKQVVSEIPGIDFEKLLLALQHKDGGEWRILLRLHPQLAAKMEKMPLLNDNDNLIDVSQEADMSQILGGCDALITDYSSCAFDAAFAGIPVLLYADDIQDYIKNRGQFMWEKDELPFSISENNEELLKNVEAFSLRDFLQAVTDFCTKHGIKEDGHASGHIVSFLFSEFPSLRG